MKKYTLIFCLLSLIVLFSCNSSNEHVKEKEVVNSKINELTSNEKIASEVIVKADTLNNSAHLSEEIKSVPIRPLKEIEKMHKDPENKTIHLKSGIYSAEDLMIWALNSQKNALSSPRPQLKVMDLDRYELMLEVEQDNEQVFWYLVSYVDHERVDYILVAAQSIKENTSFEWAGNNEVNVFRKIFNANSEKKFNLNERYKIDNDGKFHQIVK